MILENLTPSTPTHKNPLTSHGDSLGAEPILPIEQQGLYDRGFTGGDVNSRETSYADKSVMHYR